MRLYSKGCEYLIRALTRMSERERIEGFSVRVVCRRAHIPESFMRKVLQNLAHKGLLVARRGPGGGYRFRFDPSPMPLLALITAVDGGDVFDQCVIREVDCDEDRPCAMHAIWTKAKKNLLDELTMHSVGEVVRAAKAHKGGKPKRGELP